MTEVAGSDKSPGLPWPEGYSPETKLQPRVLMLDYIFSEAQGSEKGRLRVAAQEIYDVATLELVYKDGRDTNTTLRIFHAQNCTWATEFLTHKFRIQDDHTVGLQGFAGWLLREKPRRRAGKPLLVGKSWKTTADHWRGVTKCSFGLDYMKRYPYGDSKIKDKELHVSKLEDNPVQRYNVYSQRLSVYVQYATPDLPTHGPDFVSSYDLEQGPRPLEGLYDNASTIIIFDNSDTLSINDSLIPARSQWESRWKRLPFYLANDDQENDKQATLDCMKIVIQDIFKALATCWDQLLDASWEHISILGEKIYEQPTDESRAPELWSNLKHWHKYEKLMSYHVNIVNEMRKYLNEMRKYLVETTGGSLTDEGLWLKESSEDFERLSNLIQKDLVKKTDHLSDIMYKSVGFRDSRESLQLGMSMWRLSWITFIFLPLTFMVGFFGMNVDTFAGDPSIKWYFITATPFMIVVFISWYLLRDWLDRHRQLPHQRVLYEALYADLHNRRPELWSYAGPRDYIQPKGRISKIKWRLMIHWMSHKRLRTPRLSAGQISGNEPIGIYNRLKWYLVKKWIPEIEVLSGPLPDPEEDAVLAGRVEGERNSGVFAKEQMGGGSGEGGNRISVEVPDSGGNK